MKEWSEKEVLEKDALAQEIPAGADAPQKTGRMGERLMFLLMLLPVLLFLALGIHQASHSAASSYTPCIPVRMEGEWRADGGAWQPLSLEQTIHPIGCTTVELRGRLSQPVPAGECLILMMRNLWVELRVDGAVVATNRREEEASLAATPGQSVAYVPADAFPGEATVELLLSNPYPYYQADPFSDVLEWMCLGTRDALYAQMIRQEGLKIVLSLLLCGTVPLFFIFSGALNRKSLYPSLSFFLLLLCMQFYLIKESVYHYLPLFIPDPVLCMAMDVTTVHAATVTGIFYIYSSLRGRLARNFMAATFLLAILGSCTSLCLQMVGVLDLYPGQMLLFPAIALACTGGAIFLLAEGFWWKQRHAQRVFLSFSVLFLFVIVELCNRGNPIFPLRMPMFLGVLLATLIQTVLYMRQFIQEQRARAHHQGMEAEVARLQTSIMLSQIQPHFLYNALASIAQLCEKEPAQAKKAIIAFSEFLHGNMNTLKARRCVSFHTELEHLKHYLQLEKMRYEDTLNIVFDLQATDFKIPPLTVQPIVENAIKYGVGMREDGGTITISSKRQGNGFDVTIADDGVGYDPQEVQYDGRTHIGIENVRERLEKMCHGSLTITSVKGEGTTAIIHVPKHIEENFLEESDLENIGEKSKACE